MAKAKVEHLLAPVRMLEFLDPWQRVLNIPCWMPFMWETVLSYGRAHNAKVLFEIRGDKFYLEHGYHWI